VVVAAVLAGVLLSSSGAGVRLGPDEIGAIATSSGTPTLAIRFDAQPASVAVGHDGVLWVVSTEAGTLSRIDPRTHAITQITVGSDPVAVTVAPDGHSVWVANSGDGTVSRVSTESGTVVATVRVGAGPTALVATSAAVWVANTLNGSVTRIDLPTGRRMTIPVGSEPAGIAAGGGSIWVANEGDGTLSRLDPATGTPVGAPITVGHGPTSTAFGDGAAWVVNDIDGTLSRIDPQTNAVTSTRVGQGPLHVVTGPRQVWVSDEYGGTVTQVNPASVSIAQRIRTNSAPVGLALSGDRLWVATGGIGAIAHRGGVLSALASGLFFGPGGGDPPTFDPGSAYTSQLWRVLSMTDDGLVGYRRAGGVAGAALVPDLATSLPVPTDHGLTYTFRIRTGIRFSNGVLLRASDFRAGLERAFKVGGGPVQYFASLLGGRQCLQDPPSCDLSRGVVTDDAAGTVTFNLATPDPDLLNQLTLPAAFPVPPGTPVQLRQPTAPGTGPYRIASYSPAPANNPSGHGLLVLRRNSYFHQWSPAAQPTGFPDEIVVRTNYSPTEQVAAVEDGRTDLAWDAPPTSSLAALAQNFPSQLHESVRATEYLWLNVHDAPFANIMARKALNYAIDRGALASMWGTPGSSEVLPGRPTCQLLPADFPGYVRYCPYTLDPVSSGRWLRPDIAMARALVRRSGTSGAHVTLLQFTNIRRELGQAIVSTLRTIGYRAKLDDISSQAFFGPQQAQLFRSAQAGTDDWQPDYVTPSDFFVPLVTCGQVGNGGGFCDPGLDARIHKALTDQALQGGVALQEWTGIDRSVVRSAVDVPIANSLEADFVAGRVGDFQFNPQWGVLVDQLWVH
jgi:YVTN family beta-propeller protein